MLNSIFQCKSSKFYKQLKKQWEWELRFWLKYLHLHLSKHRQKHCRASPYWAVHKWCHHFRRISIVFTSDHSYIKSKQCTHNTWLVWSETRQKWWRYLWTAPNIASLINTASLLRKVNPRCGWQEWHWYLPQVDPRYLDMYLIPLIQWLGWFLKIVAISLNATLPNFSGNSRSTGISQFRAGKTRSKRPRSHFLSTGHLLPYM